MLSFQTHRIPANGPYDLDSTFYLLSMGTADPCLQRDSPTQLRYTLHTPAGPAGVKVRHKGEELQVTTFGPDGNNTGAEWLIPHLPNLLGVNYQPPTIEQPTKLARIAKEYGGMRIIRLPAISTRLVQIILQQLVSFRDACHSWRKLVHKYGTPVPNEPDLYFPPSPDVLKKLVSHQFIECGALPRLGQTVVECMKRAGRIEKLWNAGNDEDQEAGDAADRTCELLEKLPGIGPWTIGFLRGAGLSDADAVIPGDYSHPKQVAHFFGASEEQARQAEDAKMLELLEPYRPHRFYVLSLIIKGSSRLPRRGPKRESIRKRFR